MAAPDDANLDDLRRRARRRLVGAIVLALAVAVFVPMLLESDPKPLGEDVSVKIPPVDEGKFVNRLNEKSKTEAPPKTVAKAEPKAEAPRPAPSEPPRTDAPKDEAAKAEAPKDEPAKVQAAKAESAPPVAVAKAPAAVTKEPAKDQATGDFAVQVFAFSDDKGANSLVNKLKGKGFPAYSEPVNTSRGTLWRVRVGPYVSRETAGAARDKLKVEGYNGIVAAAK
jgi:DedD protein